MALAARPAAYCVDGTNVVRVSSGYGGPAFRAQEEEDSRRLLEGLELLCGSLGARVDVELFFDGEHRGLGRAGQPNLRVRFTREGSADDVILDRVRSRAWSGEGKVTVVTADGELGRRAEEEGGHWLKVRPGADMGGIFRAIERRFTR